MSSKLSWIRNIFKHWSRKSVASMRRPFRHRDVRPSVEQLEIREVLSTLTTASDVLTYTAGAGIGSNIDVTTSGGNFVFHDSAETITCGISGESGSGTNTVTVPIANVATSGVVLNLGSGDDVIDSTGMQLTATGTNAAPLTVNSPGTSLTVSGPLMTEGKSITIINTGTGDVTLNGLSITNNGNVSVWSTNNIFANADINAGSGTISIRANTNESGTAGFFQAATGSTITTTSTSATAAIITANSSNGATSSGGTGNVSIRTISDSGTLTVKAFGGSILYAGTDDLSGQPQGIIGSDNSGTGPVGEVSAKNYVLSVNSSGAGSIGTATRPLQTSSTSSTGTTTLTAGSGGAYFVDWGQPVNLSGATATGAGSVLVVAANANGHNLTVTGNVSTGSGNIVLAADDTLTINSGVIIGGTADALGEAFSGTVYLGANRDQGNTGTLLDQATITTTNTSVYNADTLTPGAVLLEDYSTTGTHRGDLTLGNITVGNGGSITATTDPTLGVYDAAATAGSGDILDGNGSSVLNAGASGTVNLIAAQQSGTTSADSAGVGANGSPILVSAGNVVVSNTTATGLPNGVENNSIYVSDAIAGSFSAVASGAVAGVIDLTDTDSITTTGLTIGGPTSTAGGGTISLTDTSGTNVTISAPLGSPGSGAIAVNAGSASAVFTTPQTFYSNDPVTITAGDPEFQPGSSVIFSGGSLTDTNGIQIDSGANLAWGTTTTGTLSPVTVAGTVAPTGTTTGTLDLTTDSLTLGPTAAFGVNASTASAYSALNVNGAVSFDPSTALQVFVIGSSLNVGDQFTVLTASSLSWSGAPATVTAINNSNYAFEVAVNGNSIVLTVTSAPVFTSFDVTSGVATFQAQGSDTNTVNVSIVNNAFTGGQNWYLITDPAESINLSANASGDGWVLADANGNANPHDAIGPIAGLTSTINSLVISTAGGADLVSGIAAGAADVTVSGADSLNVTGAITTSGNVTFSTYPTVDFEANVTATGDITFADGVGTITDGGGDTLTGATLNLIASNGIGTASFPLLTDGSTITVSSGTADAFVTQTTGSASFTATATGGTNINLADTDPAGTLTIGAATSSASGQISLTAAGNITTNASITTAGGNITIMAAGAIADNADINASIGVITIAADTAGTGVAGSADFSEASTGATITSTNTGTAISITVNTADGGTSNASIRAIADSGTLTINTFGGSMLYAGTDSLDIQQSATSTLAPGITGPVASGTGQGGSGAAPAGTVNAKFYALSTSPNGSGSIGTAARPINTSAVANNGVTLSAGSGGAYFIDWGTPLNLNGATATGAGSVEVVAANANGHNLTVAGNVATGSGNIVLAADDNLVINASVTIGGSGDPLGETFSGDVYLASNRDTGNTDTLTDSGTITTANTSASAVVVEGFHADNNGTAAGGVTVNNINVGDGGTIIVSGVPASLATGQSSIFASNTSSVLNAGPTGTVQLIATTINGDANVTTAVGTASNPITVTAGNVIVTANTGTGTSTVEPDSVYLTDTVGGNFSATTGSVSPSGTISLTTNNGVLTIAGSTNTGNNSAINLTGAGGIVVNAPLGSATTGAIALNAPSAGVQLTSANTFYGSDPVTVTTVSATEITATGTITLSPGALVDSASGVQVDNGGTLAGAGTVNTGTNQLTVDGTLAPSVSVNSLNADLILNSDATMQVTLAGTSAGQFSQVNIIGPVTLNNPTLVINVTGAFAVGDSFEIISNDSSDPVSGTFGNGTFSAANSPGYAFSVNYAGGDGNDVVLTVTQAPATDAFDVEGGIGSFASAAAINNHLTVTDVANVYTITDASGQIVLSAAASAAGWSNVNPNEITGPTSYVSGGNTIDITDLDFNTADGSDAFASLAAGAANVSINGFGSLAINGPVTTIGNASFSGFATLDFDANVSATGDVTVSGVGNITEDSGVLTGSTLTLSASNGIGTSADPVFSASPMVIASAGAGGAFISQTTGSVSFTGTATGAGSLSLADTDPAGTLTIGGATSTVSGNITFSAAGAIADNANINAGSGTITINANDLGSSAAGYTQATTAKLTTSNSTASAVTINVNIDGNGTGIATVGNATVGGTGGGYYNVNAFGGSIVWNETTVQARGTSGVPANVIKAYGFSFSDTGAGGVGTSSLPMQLTGPIENDPFSASAGSGGIYVTDFSGNDLQINQAIATDTGSINIEMANAGGHDLLINGIVTTGSGSITLYADDDLVLNGVGATTFDLATIGTQANALIGGSGFSGTVDLEANLDKANANPVIMDAGSAIFTSNTGATAVLVESYSAAGGLSDQNTPAGGVQLGNITVGAGGTITVNAAAGTSAARQGNIVQLPGTLLDTSGGSGTTYGTVVLSALAHDTSGDGNATVAAASGNIGMGGTVADPALFPILVKASTVIATTTGTNLAFTGNIVISDDVPGTFTATTTGGATGSITLTTTNGAQLTIGGATATAGGPITLTGSGGVALNATLGSTTTGAIAINGPLTGSGNIQLGTGGLTLSQSTDSSYDGAISGNSSDPVTFAGSGALTITNASPYVGATAITGGTLNVNGSLTGSSGVIVSGAGLLAGSGDISALVTDNGIVSPGGGNGGTATLSVDGLSIGAAGAFTADIAGDTAGTYDVLNATDAGTFTLNGTLNVFVNPGASLVPGDTFTILNDANGIGGTFSNAPNGASIAAVNDPNYLFTASYTGTSVVLTLAKIYTSAELDVINGNEVVYTTQAGMSSVLAVSTNGTTFTFTDTGASAITLGPGALALNWQGGGTDSVNGPSAGMTNVLVGLNDGSDSITSFNSGSANAAFVGTGTLTVNGTTTTSGTMDIGGFATVTNDATVNATTGIAISSPGSLTLGGTGSFTSANGNVLVSADLSIGNDGNHLTFSAANNGAVTFDGNGNALTLGRETVTHGALVIQNASILTLNGVLTDNGNSVSVNNVADIIAGGSENLITPTLNLATSNSIGASASNLVSSAANIVASTGAGGVFITQDGSANLTVSTSLGGAISITDPNAADTLTIAGATTTALGGNIAISAAGAIADNANINAGFGTVTIDANTAHSGAAGFSETAGLIRSANWSPTAVAITVNTSAGGTGNASIDNISAVNGTLAVQTFGGSILYAGANALTANQLGVLGGGGGAPSRTIAAEAYLFSTADTGGATGSVGTADRPLQLNSPATASFTASAGEGGVYAVDWAVVSDGGTLTLAGASATGAGGVLVVAANASGHNLTVTGPVTTGSGDILLAADDNFILSAPIGDSNFSGTVYLGANRDRGNTGTFTMTAGSSFSNSGSITTSNSSVYNQATLTPGAVLLEDYSASGTAAGNLILGNITVGTGGSITATTIPNLGVYDQVVTAGACDIVVGAASVVLTAPGGTVNLLAAPGRSTSVAGGVGTAAAPIVVSAANVVISNSTATTIANDSIYVVDQVAGTFSAVATGAAAGTINLTDSGGTLTIGGATNTTGGGAINLSSTGANGGIIIDAPLGVASSGPIAINAGTNNVLFGGASPQTFDSGDPVTITSGAAAEIGANVAVILNNGSWTSANGTQVDSGATLGGAGNIVSTVTVQGGGTLDPGAPVGALNVAAVTLNSTSNVNVTLGSTAFGNFSQLNYTATASLGGASLQVFVDGNLNVNDTFVIVSTSGGTLSGVFGSGAATITAANNPFYIFSVSYAGNEVTLTVTQVPTTDVVDVQGNSVDFFTLFGIANDLTVGLTGSNYSITDSAEPISLSQAAIAAGWTGSGGFTVTGPASYVDSSENTVNLANFAFNTLNATDTVESMVLGSANVSLIGDGTGTLDVEGNVTTMGNITLSGYTSITDGPGLLTCDVLSMTAPNGIGTAANPILTAAQSDTATAAAGAVYITQNGAGSVTVNAGGAITVSDTSGTLTVAAATTDQVSSDAVILSSADSLVLGGNVNAGAAEILIFADTDGAATAGTASYDQAGFSLITINTGDDQYFAGPDAAIITVNTPTQGLGDAVIGVGSIGSNAGGEITVNSNGGNILWSNDPVYAPFTTSQTGLANGGSNSQTLKANDYVFESLSTGAGSIGTDARPLQLDAYAAVKGQNDADMTLTAGSGGIYVTEWGTASADAITVDAATATGAGNIRIVAANAGAHNMYVDGPVSTGSGSIALYADDDLILATNPFTQTPALIGGTDLIGETFSGTVDLQANRDLGNEQILDMGAGTSIVTTNTSPDAVSLQANAANGSVDPIGDPLVPTGGVVLTSITTGGGGIIVAANAANNPSGAGLIVQRSNGLLQDNIITLIADGAGSNVFTGQVNTVLAAPTASTVSYESSGSAIDLSAASLNVTEGPDFDPAPNAAFDIVVNGTGQPIAAPFSNYSEAQIFTVGADSFQITYLGGTSGHDVVLTFLGPVITTQPTDQTVNLGSTATFTAAAFGATSTPGVQWYVNMNDGNGFQPINGANSTTLTLNNVTATMTGFEYEAVFTNSYGSATTNAATLTVNVSTMSTMTTVTSNPVGPITVGTSVTFTATISNANPGNVGTVSFYFDYGQADQFQIGGAVNVSGGSATSAATTALPAGSDTITAIYSGGVGFAGSQGTVTIQVTSSAPPPSISNVVINQNISALYNAAGQPFAGAQRSMVDDIVYTFSEAVNILSPATDPSVFTIAVASGWTGTVPTLSWAPVAGSGNMEWAVTFSGSGVSGNSIANGAYTITINDPASITAVSDGQALTVTPGTAPGTGDPTYATQLFYRLYGDINGDKFVNAADNAKFKNALTTDNAAFDYNSDGVVNALDNAKFKSDLAVSFSGFTPTI